MTTPPTPRELDLDAISLLDQAADQLPDGNLRDRICAALALASQTTCCVCGGGPVTYRNYREQPFCRSCADGRPAETACVHPDGYEGECPCPSTCVCCRPTAAAPDACLDNPQLTTALGFPVHCPHCDAPVPPTHWSKHLLRHHPEQPEPLRPRAERCPESDCTDENRCWRCDYEEAQHASATFAAGYCPHCGRGDAGPTADQYEQQRKRGDQAEAALTRLWVLAGAHRDSDQITIGELIATLEPPKGTPDA